MRGTDLGTVELDDTLAAAFVCTDSDGVPADPAVLPTFRIYGAGQTLMTGGTGSLSKIDTGTVTGATNASPIVITSSAHGLETGTPVVVSGVLGNTAANGTFRATKVNASTFSLDGSTGNGTYTSGGVWHVAGLYRITLPATGGNGYEAGKTYHAVIMWRIGSTDYSAVCPFRVV